ncbi:hypothetical protein [Paenimyroides baculatum]|uniref:Uncharacterized protein n=1 Tax=Paenimyroides baculatum TaxID=2608000 RepID=A0A5M6CD93_9FLAO|nr:hypothetical protein [Paenimyroides baculatum]KAA5533086.1 hypothetical protein F0460_12355 [Paenimyroides baculatum]
MSIDISKIRKLSDKELLGYLKPNTPYTIEALLLAVDILEKERKYIFSESEKLKIDEVINQKEQDNLRDFQEYNDDYSVPDTPENSHYPKLHSKKYVLSMGITFSSLAAGYFIFYNLKDLGLNSKINTRKLIASSIFGFVALVTFLLLYHFYGYDFMKDYESKYTGYSRYRLTANNVYVYLYLLMNGLFSYVIWDDYIPKRLQYRSKNT